MQLPHAGRGHHVQTDLIVLDRLGNAYALFFGWPALVRVHRAVMYLCGRALGLHNYVSPYISGESRSIELATSSSAAPLVFDIGANEGDWLAEVLSRSPAAKVHAFEPQETLAQRVAARFPSVAVNMMAMGEVRGELALCDYADHPGSQHASLIKGVIDGIHQGATRYVKVPVGTVDDYCAERGIERINLLKIDVEGFELKVLLGASRMLSEKRIDVIQFEFNEMNVIGRSFMNDFFACLADTHRLYRLLPHGLMPLRQGGHWINEQFTFQNVVALPHPPADPTRNH
jgi:FkbM family methyltransferase